MEQKELREQENRCIQEHAPECTATCPAHVDVRALAAELSKGDFGAAYKIYRKSVPFPGIISHVCDQPCKATCLRKDLGGAIEIAALERACLEYGSHEAEPIKPLPRKSKTMAIIGAGISGLTVAYDLARKGWGVVIYEASDRMGGGLWQTPPDALPRDVLVSDLEIIEALGVEIRLNSFVGRTGGNGHRTVLSRLCEEYDAVYLGIGPHSSDIPELRLDENGQIAIDPVTFQTSRAGVFAGGDVLRVSVNFPNQTFDHSAILSLSEGRRAATSIDRYLQNVSLTAARVNEGAYTTRLFTNTAGITSQAPHILTDLSTRYSREAAEEEAARCLQCECMECVKTCEYLKHYKGYPKKYIREIYNNLSIVMGSRNSNQFINSCSLCGLCGEVCPTDLNMASIIHNSREMMVEQKRMPPSAHEFALRDLEFSIGEPFSFARHAPSASTSLYALFPGCQLCASSPDHVEALYKRILARPKAQSEPVGLLLHCCGSPADWAGRVDLFEQSQESFYSNYEQLGCPTLILACSSCYRTFQDQYPDVKIVSLWEWMEQEALLPPRVARTNIPHLAIHDPCATRYEKDIQESVRRILQQLGIVVEELPLNREKTECCSFGGMMWLANPPLAHRVVERRIQFSESDYVTYCAMCRDFFARQGKPALHVLDLVFADDPATATRRPDPGFSLRRENRRDLKRRLLDQFWGETMEPLPEFSKVRLILSEEVHELCEQRLILQEDIQQVIDHAEKTGSKLMDRESGHWLASYRPANVTYWVEYLPEGDGVRVFRVYSHRMNVEAGGQK